jgi:hypothetical protein
MQTPSVCAARSELTASTCLDAGSGASAAAAVKETIENELHKRIQSRQHAEDDKDRTQATGDIPLVMVTFSARQHESAQYFCANDERASESSQAHDSGWWRQGAVSEREGGRLCARVQATQSERATPHAQQTPSSKCSQEKYTDGPDLSEAEEGRLPLADIGGQNLVEVPATIDPNQWSVRD